MNELTELFAGDGMYVCFVQSALDMAYLSINMRNFLVQNVGTIYSNRVFFALTKYRIYFNNAKWQSPSVLRSLGM